MEDPNKVVAQVTVGTMPSGWKVLRTRSSFFYASMGAGAGWILLGVAVAIYLFLSGTVYGIGVNATDNRAYLEIWQIIDYGILLLIIVYGIMQIVQHAQSFGTKDQQFLVLMPGGFLLRKGLQAKDQVQLMYANVVNMTTKKSSGILSLIVFQRYGGSRTIPLDGRFGAAKQVAQDIMADFAVFQTTAPGATPHA